MQESTLKIVGVKTNAACILGVGMYLCSSCNRVLG